MHNIWKYNSQLDLINNIIREIYGDYLTHFFWIWIKTNAEISRSRLVASSYEQFNFASSSSTLTRKKYSNANSYSFSRIWRKLFDPSKNKSQKKEGKPKNHSQHQTETLAKSVDAETFVFACPLELARGVEIRRWDYESRRRSSSAPSRAPGPRKNPP